MGVDVHERTKLASLKMNEMLWHQVLNRNLQHIDENLWGQGARVYAPGITQGVAGSFDSTGIFTAGPAGKEFFGVVVDVDDADYAYVVYAGYALITVAGSPAIGDTLRILGDGRGDVVSQANLDTGGVSPGEIIGTVTDIQGGQAGVMVRAAGWRSAMARVPNIAAQGVIPCAGHVDAESPVQIIAGCLDTSGGQPSGYAFYGANGISGTSVSGNSMVVSFSTPFTKTPIAQVTSGIDQGVTFEVHAGPTQVAFRLYDRTGVRLDYNTVTGLIFIYIAGV